MYLNESAFNKFLELEELIETNNLPVLYQPQVNEDDIIDTELAENPKERFVRRVKNIHNKKTNALTQGINLGIGTIAGAALGDMAGDAFDVNDDITAGLGAIGGAALATKYDDKLSNYTKPIVSDFYKKLIAEKLYNKQLARAQAFKNKYNLNI